MIIGFTFYLMVHGAFSDGATVTKTSPPDKLTQWIISQSKNFTRKSIKKIRKCVDTYSYFVLISQCQARLIIVGNSTSLVDTR